MLWTCTNKCALALCLLMSVASARLSSNIRDSDQNDDSRALFKITAEGARRGKLCLQYLLNLSDEQLFELGHSSDNTKRIGQHCYVYDNTDQPGACDYYAKGRPRRDNNGQIFADGVVISPDDGGTGCVKGGRNSFCYMNTLDRLAIEEKQSMCTDNYKKNAGAQLRWALENGYCMDHPFLPVNCMSMSIPCQDIYMGQNDEQLADFALDGKIGDYCYIEDSTPGFCDYYAKGRGNVGLPSARGTGCVKGGRNRWCFVNWLFDLSAEEKQSMCADNIRKNAGAHVRWGVEHGYCMDEGVPLTC